MALCFCSTAANDHSIMTEAAAEPGHEQQAVVHTSGSVYCNLADFAAHICLVLLPSEYAWYALLSKLQQLQTPLLLTCATCHVGMQPLQSLQSLLPVAARV